MPNVTPVTQPAPTNPINAVTTDSTPALSGSSELPGPQHAPGNATGVIGSSGSGIGVAGVSNRGDAINGLSQSPQHAGVSANNDAGGFGLWAKAAIAGQFEGNVQVNGDAANDAFNSISHSPQHAGVSANNDAGGFGLWAKATTAGYFEGAVQVAGDAGITGTLSVGGDILLEGADCAEEFDLQQAVVLDPGTVMVLGCDGALEPGSQAYDRKVVGVVSGAGECWPGLVLNRRGSSRNRAPIALMGRVFCKVDAQYGAVDAGDLLTTSPTVGHAMKASDSSRAFGAVIGKALRPLPNGQALVPVLIALQ
jgi:hypothetical protein